MNVLQREKKNATSELTRPTTKEIKPVSRFAKYAVAGALGLAALFTIGSAASAKDGPASTIKVADAQTAGTSMGAKEANKFGYKLTVNAPTNCFVGDAILVSVVNSKGEIVRGQKVEVTEPSGNTFYVSVDNTQNGFVPRTAGVYTVKF